VEAPLRRPISNTNGFFSFLSIIMVEVDNFLDLIITDCESL